MQFWPGYPVRLMWPCGRTGVLCVETIGRIRRRRLAQEESIGAVARDMGFSRYTVKRSLRFEGESFEYRDLRLLASTYSRRST